MCPRNSTLGSERGFTALEALITAVVFTIVLLFAITTFQGSHRLSRSATVQGDSQQSARLAVDVLTRDLRSLGYGVDVGLGQRPLAYAAPWDIIFNANVLPAEENPGGPRGFPRAIDLALAPARVPPGGGLYVPEDDFATGAETIRYTIDSSGDGLLSADDLADDPEEATPNPWDFVLKKEIYGALPGGTNGGTGQGIGLIRGPGPDPDGTLPTPLFTYWLDDDDDPITAAVLHGDLDADGELSQMEIATVGAVPTAALPLVTRVVITITAEDGETGGRADYRSRELVSSVSFRNLIRRSGLITGTVYLDTNSDGKFDPLNELPIPGVLIRLDTGAQYKSDEFGRYGFQVAPGTYTVTEIDPPGHSSTTPNVSTVSVTTGSTQIVDFGDRATSGMGGITGVVYSDDNVSATPDTGERGIEGVLVTLNTGVRDTTDAQGAFSFAVPVGSYTVVEVDSVGWTSTTPNAVEVTIAREGHIARVEFGDVFGGDFGTITGTVFLDENHDGVWDDLQEPGIPDVPLRLTSGDSTVTNGDGTYSFTVVPGAHRVTEMDLEGYTSSTPNQANVHVFPDSTIEINFGDLYDTSVNFTVVTVGNTDRALSIAAVDLQEDIRGDPDIILGTEAFGSANLHVWHNERTDASSAIVSLFPANATFSRTAGDAVQSTLDVDINDDGVPDAVTGLTSNTSSNLLTWVTQTTPGLEGTFPPSPSHLYTTTAGTSVLSLAPISWPGGIQALAVGAASAAGGHVEIWVGSADGSFVHRTTSDLHFDSRSTALGKVTAIAVADFNRDGYPDLAVGQDGGTSIGRVAIFLATASVPFSWEPTTAMKTEGAVLAMDAVDMKEDDQGDVDLIMGTALTAITGSIELWHNNGEGVFGNGDMRSDWIDAGGAVLSLATATLDPDVFPDVIAGTRSASYMGALSVYRGFGYLPSTGSELSFSDSGEIATLTVSDFNIDGLWDIAAGTRTALSTGELVIYFGTDGSAL